MHAQETHNSEIVRFYFNSNNGLKLQADDDDAAAVEGGAATGGADDDRTARAAEGGRADAVSGAGEADEAARVQLRPVQPRHTLPDRT